MIWLSLVGKDFYGKKKSQNQKQCSSPSSYPWPYICLKTKSQSITNICMQKVIQIYSDNGAQFKCTVINDGHDKLKQMSTNLKGISRKLKRYTKTLNQITRFMDETWMWVSKFFCNLILFFLYSFRKWSHKSIYKIIENDILEYFQKGKYKIVNYIA